MNVLPELWQELVSRYSRCSRYEDDGVTLSSAINSSTRSNEEYRLKTLFVRDAVLDVKYVSKMTHPSLEQPLFIKHRFFSDFKSAPRTMWSFKGEQYTHTLKRPVSEAVRILHRITFVPSLLLGLSLDDLFGFSVEVIQGIDRCTYQLQSCSQDHRLVIGLEKGSCAVQRIEFESVLRSEAEASLQLIAELPEDAPEAWLKRVDPNLFRDVTEHRQVTEYTNCKIQND